MARTFLTLAVLLTLAILLTIAVGFWSFFLQDLHWKKDIFIVHFYLGLGTILGILLVHCLIFTYFLGTGRWVKEVGLAYNLPDHDLPKTTRELKRQTFPPALFSMLFAIAAGAAGAGAQLQAWPWYVHAALAILTLLVNLWAFQVEYRCLSVNANVIQAVLDEVDRIRQAMGLNPNAEALAENSTFVKDSKAN
ncbi:MAG: hypothetical protein L0215_01620 [Gemmataceae bacterium]|nr:hypothetical protein [Gemmataceae bacterium]